MSEKVLVVVDMQNDFIDGSLGTVEAVAIVPAVVKTVGKFDGQVVFTRDTHFEDYMDTQEGKNLPVKHCIKGTNGWEICEALKGVQTEDMKIFDKNTFGSVDLCKYLSSIENLTSVTLVGLCTDICVISNAMAIKAFLPEVEIQVIADCCAGVTPKSHSNALEAMKVCQIKVM